ncbi:hypothetical protein Trydic_g19781 [Trypoxylus dichotomus]
MLRGAGYPAPISASISKEDGFLREGQPKNLWFISPSIEQEQYGNLKSPIRKRAVIYTYSVKGGKKSSRTSMHLEVSRDIVNFRLDGKYDCHSKNICFLKVLKKFLGSSRISDGSK